MLHLTNSCKTDVCDFEACALYDKDGNKGGCVHGFRYDKATPESLSAIEKVVSFLRLQHSVGHHL